MYSSINASGGTRTPHSTTATILRLPKFSLEAIKVIRDLGLSFRQLRCPTGRERIGVCRCAQCDERLSHGWHEKSLFGFGSLSSSTAYGPGFSKPTQFILERTVCSSYLLAFELTEGSFSTNLSRNFSDASFQTPQLIHDYAGKLFRHGERLSAVIRGFLCGLTCCRQTPGRHQRWFHSGLAIDAWHAISPRTSVLQWPS